MTGYKYETVVQTFIDKGCKMLNTEEEFNEIRKEASKQKKHPKFKYIASCGCENIIHYHLFLNCDSGVLCKKCICEKNGKTKKEENTGISSLELEYNSIQYFTELVNEHFEIVKLFDGCKADIVFRPLNITDNLWCGLQVKSTNTTKRGCSFRLHNNNYENLIILCVCFVDKRMWLIPYENVRGLTQLTIGLKKSKYDIFEVKKENIINKLHGFYNNTTKFDFDILNIPKTIYQQREQEYRKFREEKLDFITFINNDMEGLVYDFKIGDKKVQEKVGSKKNNKNYYSFCLCKNNGKIEKIIQYTQYKQGDNDLYILNCEGKKYFYVFPEQILIEKGFINNDKKKFLSCNPLNKKMWYNDYLFDYENVNKEKILKIIGL